MEVGVLGEVHVELLLCTQGTFLIETVDVVDLINGTLIAGTHIHLLTFCTLFPLSLLLVELQQFLPELVGRLLLELATAFLAVLELLVSGLQVFFVILCLLGLLGLNFLLVLGHFLSRGHQLLPVAGPPHRVLLLLAAIEFQLVGGTLNGVVDVVLVV